MIGDVLCGLERALVLEVRGDIGRTERVIADPGFYAGVRVAPLNHPVSVLLPQGVARKRAGLAGRRAEQRPVRVAGDAGGGDLFVEVLFQIVVTKNLVLLAAVLVEAHVTRVFGEPPRAGCSFWARALNGSAAALGFPLLPAKCD